MVRHMKVLRGMLVFRRIAAADMTTNKTHSEMDPTVPYLQTILAAGSARLNVTDLIKMSTGWLWHHGLVTSLSDTRGQIEPPWRLLPRPMRPA